MADKRVGTLPTAEVLNDEDILVLEQDGVVKKIAGEVLKGLIDLAQNGIPAGGQPNQMLVKASGEPYGVKWVSVLDEHGRINPALLPIHCVAEPPPDGTALNGHIYLVYGDPVV